MGLVKPDNRQGTLHRLLSGFSKNSLIGVVITLGILLSGWLYAGIAGEQITVTTLQVPDAPGRIVYITDPHIREGNIHHIRSLIAEINRLDPDLVLIGGDVTFGEKPNLSLQKVWSGIDAPAYAILGNHEYLVGAKTSTLIPALLGLSNYSSEDGFLAKIIPADKPDFMLADLTTRALEENGVTVLRNSYQMPDVNGSRVLVVGLDDCWAAPGLSPTVPDTDAFTVYLVHEPDCMQKDWQADLVLAGHTHGGQVIPEQADRILAEKGIKIAGMFQGVNATEYVSRGAGTSNFETERRLFNTPEIVLITP